MDFDKFTQRVKRKSHGTDICRYCGRGQVQTSTIVIFITPTAYPVYILRADDVEQRTLAFCNDIGDERGCLLFVVGFLYIN